MQLERFHVLPNSGPAIRLGARRVGRPPLNKRIRVTIIVRRNRGAAAMARVARFARNRNLRVVAMNLRRRRVVVAGPVRRLERVFRVRLARFRFRGRLYRANVSGISIPQHLARIVARIVGFNTLPPRMIRGRAVRMRAGGRPFLIDLFPGQQVEVQCVGGGPGPGGPGRPGPGRPGPGRPGPGGPGRG
jgi:hypothetical protein